MKQLVIVGAGGFGRETLDACLASELSVTAFLDDRREGQIRSIPVLPVDGWSGREPVVVAVADPSARQTLVDRLGGVRPTFATVVDPRAIVGPETSVGEGSIVLATAFVSSSVALSEHVQVNYGATIGHDTIIGPFCTVLPGAHIAGAVKIGAGTTVGSGAVILQGLEVGEGTTVGAGAVVTHDVPANTTVVGVPARPFNQ